MVVASAQDVFAAAVAVVGPVLKQRGFRRRASKFTRMGEQIASLVEFQRSRDSSSRHLSFAINYGVAALSLLQVEGVDGAKLWWTQCHWQHRVAGPDGREAWLSVRDTDDPNELAARLTPLVERDVLPVLEEKQSEADLVRLWMSGQCGGLVDARRLLCLGRLLHRAGRRAEAVQVRLELEQLRESPFTLRASEKLREIEEQAGQG
jgi:hypothetical protein